MKISLKQLLRNAVLGGSVFAICVAPDAYAAGRGGGGRVGGGGGARPSMGSFGGGGGRPSMGGGGMSRPPISRPSPSISRPSPSLGSVSRPSVSARPSLPTTRPSVGNFNPSGGGMPSLSRPTTLPGNSGLANRPISKPPSSLKPTTRPSLPGGNTIGGNRPTLPTTPSLPNRPTLPGNAGIGGNTRPALPGTGVDRPSIGGINRPTTLPGNITRPGIGGGDRPTIGGGDRPTTLPGNVTRPGIGGGDRPIIGGGNRPGTGDRPIIGGGNNRPSNGGNINIGNNVNIGNGNWNRPAWDRPNYNNPGWGWGHGGDNWAGNWHDHCINNHHGWYNGCWHGYWGSSWYRPLAWGVVGWGLGSWTSGWGYGTGYYNPYYVEPAAQTTVPYDYSQPVVVNNYISSDDGTSTQTPAQTPAADQGLKLFDDGLALFKAGNYQQALSSFDQSLQKLPGDPVVHEVRALTLFALGQYQQCAAALNSFLSSAPGMDWTTLSSLYGNTDDYTAQLRKLEAHCKANPNDAAAAFVLAYQYLVVGSKDSAINALRYVVKLQPKDVTAKRMLDALAPPAPAATTPPPATGANQPTTDLVGTWRATAGTTTIQLKITEDSKFEWQATEAGKPPVVLSGTLTAENDALVLQSEKQGPMAGNVKSLGADKWQFTLDGAPPTDPGLSFSKVGM